MLELKGVKSGYRGTGVLPALLSRRLIPRRMVWKRCALP